MEKNVENIEVIPVDKRKGIFIEEVSYVTTGKEVNSEFGGERYRYSSKKERTLYESNVPIAQVRSTANWEVENKLVYNLELSNYEATPGPAVAQSGHHSFSPEYYEMYGKKNVRAIKKDSFVVPTFHGVVFGEQVWNMHPSNIQNSSHSYRLDTWLID